MHYICYQPNKSLRHFRPGANSQCNFNVKCLKSSESLRCPKTVNVLWKPNISVQIVFTENQTYTLASRNTWRWTRHSTLRHPWLGHCKEPCSLWLGRTVYKSLLELRPISSRGGLAQIWAAPFRPIHVGTIPVTTLSITVEQNGKKTRTQASTYFDHFLVYAQGDHSSTAVLLWLLTVFLLWNDESCMTTVYIILVQNSWYALELAKYV